MSERRGLVLDSNILLRAVFGKRVRQILEKYEDEARFYTPDVCFEDARRYIPVISNERGFDVDLGLSVLEQIGCIVEQVDRSLYEEYQDAAHGRGARTHRPPRSGRLASCCYSVAARLADLDGGSGFLRQRCRDMDERSGRTLFAGTLTQFCRQRHA